MNYKFESESYGRKGDDFYLARDKRNKWMYIRSLRLNPRDNKPYIALANSLLIEKKYTLGLNRCNKSLSINPSSNYGHTTKAYILKAQGKYDEVRIVCSNLLKMNQRDSETYAYELLGLVAEDEGNLQEAEKFFFKAIALGSRDEYIYCSLIQILWEQQKYDQGLEICQKLLQINPRSCNAYIFWGGVLYYQEKYDEGVAKYHKALEINPNSSMAITNWGLALYAQHKYTEAIEKFKRGSEIATKDFQIFWNWGLALYQLGKHKEAEETFNKGVNYVQEEPIAKIEAQKRNLRFECSRLEERLVDTDLEAERTHLKGTISGMKQILQLLERPIINL